MNEEYNIDEYIQKAYEAVEEMHKRDHKGMSLIDIMRPTQHLYNLLSIKMNSQLNKLKDETTKNN